MSNKLFTVEEIEDLSQNPHVQSVSSKGITYTDNFKEIFIASYSSGMLPREIFEAHGFRVEVLGIKRIHAAQSRWNKAYQTDGVIGLKDSRKGNSGRPITRNLTLEEKNARLKAEIHMLRAENELLKNIDRAERGLRKKR